jgi:hypothetical protein
LIGLSGSEQEGPARAAQCFISDEAARAGRLPTPAFANQPHAERSRPFTLGADKGYDSADFVMDLR